ncbi:MAG TPA: class I SAM-dependent methyltransferase [Methanosarcina sp.]
MTRNVGEYFETIASDFDSYYEKPKNNLDALINAGLRRPGLLKRLKITLTLSNPKEEMKILEIGCGSGKYIVECAKKGADTWGIDISPEMIRLAKRFCAENQVHAHLSVGDALKKLPQGFDVCVALGVFEYFKNPLPILNNMIAATNKNGKIIFSVPKQYAFQTPLREMMLHYRNVDCYYYTKGKVKKLLNNKNHNIYDYGPGYVVEYCKS